MPGRWWKFGFRTCFGIRHSLFGILSDFLLLLLNLFTSPPLRFWDDWWRCSRPRHCFVADPQVGTGHITDEIFELIQLGQPLICLVEVFYGRIDPRGECLCILGGDSIGAEEFDLLLEPVLFRKNQL